MLLFWLSFAWVPSDSLNSVPKSQCGHEQSWRDLLQKRRCFLTWPRLLEKCGESWGVAWTILSSTLASPSCLQGSVTRRHTPADSSDCHPGRQRSGVLGSWLKDDQYACFPSSEKSISRFCGKQEILTVLPDKHFLRSEVRCLQGRPGRLFTSAPQRSTSGNGQATGNMDRIGEVREPSRGQNGRASEDRIGVCPAWPEQTPGTKQNRLKSRASL